MSIAREEIFGPVLSVIPFADEDEAVRIANDTEYGPRRHRLDQRHQAGHADDQAIRVRAPSASTATSWSRTWRSAATGSPASAARAAGPPSRLYTELKTVLLPFTDEMM